MDTTQLEPGCYVDGHWGIFAYQRVTEIAADFGYTGQILTADDCRNSSEDVDITDIVDAATDWLNENVAEEGHSFGWFDGEFYYDTDEQWLLTY